MEESRPMSTEVESMEVAEFDNRLRALTNDPQQHRTYLKAFEKLAQAGVPAATLEDAAKSWTKAGKASLL